MQKFYYNLLLVFGLIMVLGMSSAVSAHSFLVATEKEDVPTKIPKNMSRLSVKTDEPMTVYLDGVQIGNTQGNQAEFAFDVIPGNHEVKVMNTDGKDFTRIYPFEKGKKNCICLKTNRNETKTPCPYNIFVSGPEKVTEGDLITFVADNRAPAGVDNAALINYIWRVRPDNARVTSGLGTSSITIDTTGLGGQNITAEIESTNGFHDEVCRQKNTVATIVDRIPEPKRKPFEEFDMVAFKVFDDVKARLDNFVVGLQNRVDGNGYMIFYQGTEKKSPDARKTAARVLDYLVKARGMDPSRITIIHGGYRQQTTISMYFVYPGGEIPIPAPQ
jgi:hypothetical protein